MGSGKALLRLFVVGLFLVSYASPQNPQTPQSRPAPGGGGPPGGGNRPGGGGPPGGGNRPGPGGGGNNGGSRPNPGGPQIQPVRPSPGGGNNRPGPGNGNNRPQPPRPGPGTRPPVRPPNRPGPGRPPSWGRPPQNRPSYNFRRNDWSYLHRYYQRSLISINIGSRPRFAIGGFFPYAYIPYITPLPPNVYGYLPPPPPGYNMGYYDGYVVVYDPVTYYIANVVDLLQQQ
jgi:hypothetical protein